MALRDFKPSGKIKAQNFGDGVPMPDAGNCSDCGNWDSELKHGLCADCRKVDHRIAKAKAAIKAGQTIGVVWTGDENDLNAQLAILRAENAVLKSRTQEDILQEQLDQLRRENIKLRKAG